MATFLMRQVGEVLPTDGGTLLVRYMHSGTKSLERVRILKRLREGEICALVGVRATQTHTRGQPRPPRPRHCQ